MQKDTIRRGSEYRVRIGGKHIDVVTICCSGNNPLFWLCANLATGQHVTIGVEEIEAARDDERRK